MPRYKVMIIAASFGGGHIQAGRALKSALAAHTDVEIEFIDFADASSSYSSQLVKRLYLLLLTVCPSLYGFLYRQTQTALGGWLASRLTARMMKKPMHALLTRNNPDIIICTHPFPCGGAAELVRLGRLHVPVIAVITDFVIHRLWHYPDVTQYYVADPSLKSALEQLGVSANHVRATGIPIQAAFAQTIPPQKARILLGLDPDLATILLMGGSLGIQAVQTALFHLNQITLPLNIIAVAGTNASLRKDLESLAAESPHQTKILGYTQEVPLLMSAADILVTKPGALTISEALAKGLPLLLCQPLPGQEEDNAAYLIRFGAACRINDEQQLQQELFRLLQDKPALEALRTKAVALGRPGAAADIAAAIYETLISSAVKPHA